MYICIYIYIDLLFIYVFKYITYIYINIHLQIYKYINDSVASNVSDESGARENIRTILCYTSRIHFPLR